MEKEELMMIITVTIGSAVVIVVIIVWIGFIYYNKSREKLDDELPKLNTIDNLRYTFPEKLETLETYFEQHESDDTSMFVSNVGVFEKKIQKDNKQTHERVQNNQDDRSETVEEKDTSDEKRNGTPELEITSGNEMRTEVHATSKVERGNNSEVNMIASNNRTEQDDIMIDTEDDIDIDIYSSSERIMSAENEIVSASDENDAGDITSSELFEYVNADSNETNSVSTEIANVGTIKHATTRGECTHTSQDDDSGSKLRFLETILTTNSIEDLHEQIQTTGSKKRGKKRRKGMLLNQIQLGLFRYYFYRIKSNVKKSKRKKNSRVGPSATKKQTRRTPSPSRRHCVSYPRPDGRMDQNTAEMQTKKQHSVMVGTTKCDKKTEETSLTTSTIVSGNTKPNLRTENGSLSKKSSARYDSSAIRFTLSLPRQ